MVMVQTYLYIHYNVVVKEQHSAFLPTQLKYYPYPRCDKVRERRVHARHSTYQLGCLQLYLTTVIEHLYFLCYTSDCFVLTLFLKRLRWSRGSVMAGSNPAEAVGIFRAKKSSARLPSEGK